MIPQADIRALRENSPNNLATLCFKSVDTLIKARDAMCPATDHKKLAFLLQIFCVLIILEDAEWSIYFWTALPTENKEDASIPIAAALLSALSDLLFCPNFTIAPPNSVMLFLAYPAFSLYA
uniref:Uncharacterized protein n=1 Tax=Ditylenchus dipsaci TaxID=166011 RepID=A0A915DJQ1_9BILA